MLNQWSILNGEKYFIEDGSQNYLTFEPLIHLLSILNPLPIPDPDKYSYSGYGISSDIQGNFSLPSGGFGKNIIIFGADTSPSVYVDNKKIYLNSCQRSNAGVRQY